jgi:hypothetical protein
MTPLWEKVIYGVITVIVAMVCTGILAPMIVGHFQRKTTEKDTEREKLLKERDDARKEVEENWHSEVKSLIGNLDSNVTQALNASSKDRGNIWERLNNHGHIIVCNNDSCHAKTDGVTIPQGK